MALLYDLRRVRFRSRLRRYMFSPAACFRNHRMLLGVLRSRRDGERAHHKPVASCDRPTTPNIGLPANVYTIVDGREPRQTLSAANCSEFIRSVEYTFIYSLIRRFGNVASDRYRAPWLLG
jgi:hypothetical protein